MTGRSHPQVRALIDAAAGAAADEPADARRRCAPRTCETALELGGAAEEVAAVEDVVIARADGAGAAARVYRPRRRRTRWARSSGCTAAAGCIGRPRRLRPRRARALANAAGPRRASASTTAWRPSTRSRPPSTTPTPRCAGPPAGRGAARHRPAARGGRRRQRGRPARGRRGRAARAASVAARAAARLPGARRRAWTRDDLRASSPTADAHARPRWRACWTAYVAGGDRDDPDVSPLRAADLAGAAAGLDRGRRPRPAARRGRRVRRGAARRRRRREPRAIYDGHASTASCAGAASSTSPRRRAPYARRLDPRVVLARPDAIR